MGCCGGHNHGSNHQHNASCRNHEEHANQNTGVRFFSALLIIGLLGAALFSFVR